MFVPHCPTKKVGGVIWDSVDLSHVLRGILKQNSEHKLRKNEIESLKDIPFLEKKWGNLGQPTLHSFCEKLQDSK